MFEKFDPIDVDDFGKALLGWRRKNKMSRDCLAEITGISVNTLMRLEKHHQHGVRLDVYNALVGVMAVDLQFGWWSEKKSVYFVYSRGVHAAGMFAAVAEARLFGQRYQRGRDWCNLMRGGESVMLWAGDFAGGDGVVSGWLRKMPRDYGYMAVTDSQQGAFAATWVGVGDDGRRW